MIEKKAQGGTGGGIDIDSPDGSIDVKREGERVEISINEAYKYDLVTEEENGIARAFDKKVLDHSLHNVVPFGEHSDEDSAVQELTSVDSMYAPRIGQMLDWRDENGDYHLSRYSYETDFRLPVGSQWSSVVYDDVHDTICALSFGVDGEHPKEGSFLVATRKVRGVWKTFESGATETWFQLVYGNGIIVAMSGNESKEFAVSRDGGFTWEFGVLPTKQYYIRVRFIDGKFYFICPQGYYASRDMTEFESFVNVTKLLDITERDGGLVYFTGETSGTIYYIDETPIGGDSKMFSGFRPYDAFYYVGNGVYFVYSDFGMYRDDPGHTPSKISNIAFLDYDVTPADGNLANTSIAMQTFTPLEEVILKKEDDLVRLYAISAKIASSASFVREFIFQPSTKRYSWLDNADYFYYNYATHACIVRGQYLFAVVGASRNGGNNSATESRETSIWTYRTLERTTIDFNPWEEIPLIPEEAEGLVCVDNKKVYEVNVGEFLKFKDKALSTIHSDRYTEYLNYPLTIVREGVEYKVWCPVALEDIVDGSTLVYEDEECTYSIGTIMSHDYNPNNPTDVEVSIGGNTLVFTFHTSKIPESLATTKAIIDAVNELKKKIKIGVAVFYRNSANNPWTQANVAWSSDHYTTSPSTTPGFMCVVTTDGQEPDLVTTENVAALFQWTAGSTFGIDAIVPFETEEHGFAPIQISL